MIDYRTAQIEVTEISMSLTGTPTSLTGASQDWKAVLIGGHAFPSHATVDVKVKPIGVVRVGFRAIKSSRIEVTEFGIVQATRPVTRPMLDLLASGFDEIVFQAVDSTRRFYKLNRDTDVTDYWRQLMRAQMPKRGSGESASEYVYRLWVDVYKPAGRKQRELAKDLVMSHDTVREYVSKESRRNGGKR